MRGANRVRKLGKLSWILIIELMLIASPASALSVDEILKGSAEFALNKFISEISPIDGWAKLDKGDALVIKGKHFWNPSYHIVFKEGKVKFWGPIPTGVDIKVEVYKVYFGILALYQGEKEDIWWTKSYFSRDGQGWVGDFFISGFEWKLLGGESEVSTAWVCWNTPSASDLPVESLNFSQNYQINGSVKVVKDWNSLVRLRFGSLAILGGGAS
jgi:hypothetical protein